MKLRVLLSFIAVHNTFTLHTYIYIYTLLCLMSRDLIAFPQWKSRVKRKREQILYVYDVVLFLMLN